MPTAFVSGLREWWRWRMRQRRVHIYGIAEFRMQGTVVRFERGRWVVEGEDERPVFVEGSHPSAVGLSIGDRVEVEPLFQSSLASAMSAEHWTIVRKIKRDE